VWCDLKTLHLDHNRKLIGKTETDLRSMAMGQALLSDVVSFGNKVWA
jgi:hypothetical protein